MNRTTLRYVVAGVCAAATIMFVAAGCSEDTSGNAAAVSPSPLTITGSVTTPIDVYSVGEQAIIGKTPCKSKSGFADVRVGAQVTVRDAAGATVGLGSLTGGVVDADPGVSIYKARCRFEFKVAGVAAGSDYYSVEVAHRGEVSYAAADLTGGVDLSLGKR